MRQTGLFLDNRSASCLAAVLLLMVCSLDSLAEADLTGVWSCDDGGLYYIRQLGDTLWWYGEQSLSNPAFSNVATGTINGNTISLNWADVPKGQTTSSGILVLNIESSDRLTALQKTGGFGGSTWTRAAAIPVGSPAAPGPTPTPMQPSMGTQLLDHAMSNNVDEASSEINTRTTAFSVSDDKAYSWLSLGNVVTAKIEWIWYSPANNTYATNSFDVPMPTSSDYWTNYRVFSYIKIAGFNAADMPGNWHLDVYLDGQKLSTEQFTLGTSGPGTPPSGPTASVPVSPGTASSTPAIPGTNAAGPTTPGANESLAAKLGLNANDPTIIEMF